MKFGYSGTTLKKAIFSNVTKGQKVAPILPLFWPSSGGKGNLMHLMAACATDLVHGAEATYISNFGGGIFICGFELIVHYSKEISKMRKI